MFTICIDILNLCQTSQEQDSKLPLKKSLIVTNCAIALRILMDNEIDKTFKDEAVVSLLK